METSVFRKESFASEDTIWEIGKNVAGRSRGKNPKAKADFVSKIVRELNLDVVPETSTHKLHAAIIHWPEEKDSQMFLAKELAKNASTTLNNSAF